MQSQISIIWIRVFVFLIFAICAVFFYRLYFLQVAQHENFEELSSKQYYNPYSDKQERGSIIFRYKDGRDFFAATNKAGYTIEINPQIIKNPEDTYNILSSLMDLDVDDYFAKATKEDDNSEILAKRVDIEIGEKVRDLDLQGVIVTKEKWRFYPGKELASQVLGFQSYKEDEFKGRYGLERFYDDVLSKDDDSLFKNFFVEFFSGIEETFSGKKGEGNIISTIEPNIQTFTEESIRKVQDRWGSKKTGAIIMDPNTGAIYSMALTPSFDINSFNEEDNISIYNNDSVESVYEMGSIMKPLTMAIGLDTESVTAETTYDDRGFLELNTEKIYNYDKKGRGVVSMQEVLNQSLNTGAAYVALKVGNETFSKYMKELIGEKSGIDLPNEVSPLVDNLDSPRDIEHATASYGHGVAMTPVQTIRALATLSNGGYLVQPHVIQSVKYEMGHEKEIAPKGRDQIFKNSTSREISRMLTEVVDKALLGGTVYLPDYSVAAKTGTALVTDEQGGYYEDTFFHSFFGYFPSYNPQFIILLYTIEPKGVQYASHTLTEPFMDLVKYLINYYEIEPDRNYEENI
jgi:cell division protein FtsI/penicillin-binding protein 2